MCNEAADSGNNATDCDIDVLLDDPSKQAAIIQHLGQLGLFCTSPVVGQLEVAKHGFYL